MSVAGPGGFADAAVADSSARIVVAAATGARRGELCGLMWSDIDFEAGVLRIERSLEETNDGLRLKPTKSDEPRKISLPAIAVDVLLEHRREQDRDRVLFGSDYQDRGLVFCRPDGEFYCPDKLSSRVTELTRKIGLHGVGLHTLRHSHASELISKHTPITVISERLGHAHPGITHAIYSHALKADNAAAGKTWNDAMADVIQAAGNLRRPGC